MRSSKNNPFFDLTIFSNRHCNVKSIDSPYFFSRSVLITGVGAGLQLDGEELRGFGPFHAGTPQGAPETTLVSTLSVG